MLEKCEIQHGIVNRIFMCQLPLDFRQNNVLQKTKAVTLSLSQSLKSDPETSLPDGWQVQHDKKIISATPCKGRLISRGL